MSRVDVVAVIVWLGVVLYAVFGGADYGAGVWDLLAGTGRESALRRRRIERSIGPVWEANHVWLIFVLVFLWTGFPAAFVAIVTTLFIPLLLVGVGIVYRGASFAFRKSSTTFVEARWFGALFAGSSLVTPFFLGAVAGGVASGRVPADGTGALVSSWINPTSILGGLLAVGTCVWSAAVLLAADSDRVGDAALARWFGRGALVAGGVVGATSLGGIVVLRHDAPRLAAHLQGRAAPLVVASALAGLGAMIAVARGRYRMARLPAVVAVVAVVVGWGVGQYPYVLEDRLTLDRGAGSPSTLLGLIVAFLLAAVTVVPSLIWLYVLTDRGTLDAPDTLGDSSAALIDRLFEERTPIPDENDSGAML